MPSGRDTPLYALARLASKSITPWSRSRYTASFIEMAYQMSVEAGRRYEEAWEAQEEADQSEFIDRIKYLHNLEELAGKGKFDSIMKKIEFNSETPSGHR